MNVRLSCLFDLNDEISHLVRANTNYSLQNTKVIRGSRHDGDVKFGPNFLIPQ